MLTSFFVAAPNKPTAELSDTAQRKWIKQVYETLGMKFLKVTHAGRGSGSQIAKGLNIEEDQICRAECWNTDSMHRGYLTTLPQKFMRGMAGFNPNHPDTYRIARTLVHPPDELLNSFWTPLNDLVNFPFNDIGTAQFVKLLFYLRIVLLQDAAIFYSRFPTHPLFQHDLFKMPAFEVFSAEVLAQLDETETDQNILIRQAMPLVSQSIVDLEGRLDAKMKKIIREIVREIVITRQEVGKVRDDIGKSSLNEKVSSIL